MAPLQGLPSWRRLISSRQESTAGGTNSFISSVTNIHRESTESASDELASAEQPSTSVAPVLLSSNFLVEVPTQSTANTSPITPLTSIEPAETRSAFVPTATDPAVPSATAKAVFTSPVAVLASPPQSTRVPGDPAAGGDTTTGSGSSTTSSAASSEVTSKDTPAPSVTVISAVDNLTTSSAFSSTSPSSSVVESTEASQPSSLPTPPTPATNTIHSESTGVSPTSSRSSSSLKSTVTDRTSSVRTQRVENTALPDHAETEALTSITSTFTTISQSIFTTNGQTSSTPVTLTITSTIPSGIPRGSTTVVASSLSPASSTVNTGAIVGGAIGGVILILAGAILALILTRRKKRRTEAIDEYLTAADPFPFNRQHPGSKGSSMSTPKDMVEKTSLTPVAERVPAVPSKNEPLAKVGGPFKNMPRSSSNRTGSPLKFELSTTPEPVLSTLDNPYLEPLEKAPLAANNGRPVNELENPFADQNPFDDPKQHKKESSTLVASSSMHPEIRLSTATTATRSSVTNSQYGYAV